jgi:hypothetical protein
VSPGEGFPWLPVSPPDQPEVQLVLAKPGRPLDEEEAAFIRRQLGKGHMGGLGDRPSRAREPPGSVPRMGR